MMRRFLVTGASGFLGRRVCSALLARGWEINAAVRNESLFMDSPYSELRVFKIGEINSRTEWSTALEGVDCVFHCAGRAHVTRETSGHPLQDFRTVNVEGTRRLAEQSVLCGVRRFVFVSSVGVLGTNTDGRGPFSAADSPAPVEDYAISKLEAEEALRKISTKYGIELVVVRPPLVYGSGAKGNLARLLRIVESRIPLPLGSVENRRSLVSVDNLVDMLLRCVDHPHATEEPLLVSDGEDLSTPDLVQRIGRMKGFSPRIFPLPLPWLRFCGVVLGRGSEVSRLIGSLQLDIDRTCEILDWRPPLTVDEGLRRMIETCGSQ